MKKLKIDIELAKDLYKSGMSLDKVGDALGVDGTYLGKRFRQMGFKVRSYRPKPGSVKKPKVSENGQKLCSCCGLRYVPKKPVNGELLTRLCYECYSTAGDDFSGQRSAHYPNLTASLK